MFKKLWNFNFLYIILLAFSAVQTALMFFLSEIFFYFSLILLVDVFKSHPATIYALSIASFNTAGIAAYIGQHTLNISTYLSICSLTNIPLLLNLNGFI